MNGHPPTTVPSRLYTGDSVSLDEFKQLCSRTTDPSTYPLSETISRNVPIYDIPTLEQTPDNLAALQDEWHHILHSGPGVFVLRNMYNPAKYASVLAATNAAYDHIISTEKSSAAFSSKGDHFAAGGTNDRIWNAFSKHELADPASFMAYYSNPWLAAVCTAWLGPGYRVTAQVNAVHPGGAAQQAHRDYHLGFQEEDKCIRYPIPLQNVSQFLTLQGAVAHTDMPVESGPTRYLPFSQAYAPGYLAWRREEFRAFFQERYVALPLALGDGVFFNPALFHAAGANVMDPQRGGFRRVANLLQISAAMGKTMESVETVPLFASVWDLLLEKYKGEARGVVADVDMEPRRWSLPAREVRAFVQALVEGYPFPTNLDKRPPAPSGMAPENELDLVLRGLEEGWEKERVVEEIGRLQRDSRA
jgi:ectoine hydroxylase-related dioxygenase (phytanoyl-CoA dioxygenase family)